MPVVASGNAPDAPPTTTRSALVLGLTPLAALPAQADFVDDPFDPTAWSTLFDSGGPAGAAGSGDLVIEFDMLYATLYTSMEEARHPPRQPAAASVPGCRPAHRPREHQRSIGRAPAAKPRALPR